VTAKSSDVHQSDEETRIQPKRDHRTSWNSDITHKVSQIQHVIWRETQTERDRDRYTAKMTTPPSLQHHMSNNGSNSNNVNNAPSTLLSAEGEGEETLSTLEQEVLDEYARLGQNLAGVRFWCYFFFRSLAVSFFGGCFLAVVCLGFCGFDASSVSMLLLRFRSFLAISLLKGISKPLNLQLRRGVALRILVAVDYHDSLLSLPPLSVTVISVTVTATAMHLVCF